MREAPEAIIVQYRAPEVEQLVSSLVASGVPRVWVVDNAATAAGEVTHAGVVWVRPGRNLGYGAAVNRVLARVASPYVAILNPDLVLEAGTLERLVAVLEDRPRAAIVGPRILTADGEPYPSHRRFPSLGEALGHAVLGPWLPQNRFTRSYREERRDPTEPIECDWISGACMVARVDALRAVGGFDPRYHLYMEDVDLCRRLWRFEMSVWFDPSARVTHIGGSSTRTRRRYALWQHHRSMLIYGMLEQQHATAQLVVGLGVCARFAALVVGDALRAGRRREAVG